MGTTSNRSYPYPAGSDPVDVPGDLESLADAVDADVAAVIAGTGLADGSVTDAKLAVPKVNQSVVGNLLTAGRADFEDGTTVLRGTGTWASIINDNTYASSGTRSCKGTVGAVTSGVNLHPHLTSLGSGTSGDGTVAVTPGQPYTASAMLRGSHADSWRIRIYWYAGATLLSGDVVSSSFAALPTTGFARYQISGVAPATATGAEVVITRDTGTASADIYVDEVGIWQGAGGLWAPPGTPIANLGTYTDESVGRRIFTWDAVNARWQMTYGDTGWRDVSAGLLNSWSGTLLVRRQNDRVTAVIKTLSGASTFAQMYSLPAGFGSGDVNVHGSAVFREGGVTGTPGWMTMAGAVLPQYGGLFSGAWSASHSVTLCQVSWSTAQAWPTSLPGTASGSIPS